MVRGSTGSLIWDNAVMRFLFVSDSNEDKDKKLINERDKMDKQMEKLIFENLEYFHNLPKEYSESLH